MRYLHPRYANTNNGIYALMDIKAHNRDSIKIFNEFYSTYAKKDKFITMAMVCSFFDEKHRDGLVRFVPEGFLDSLVYLYNYTVSQKVKESLYYYNENRISREIQNYLFAINF